MEYETRGGREVSYRANHRYRRSEPSNGDFRETLLMQCTVCAVIMALVLGVCVVDISPVRTALRRILTQHSQPPPEAMAILEGTGQLAQNILSGFKAPDIEFAPDNASQDAALNTAEPITADNSASNDDTPEHIKSDRIDEDILSIINEREDYYMKALEGITTPVGEPITGKQEM